MIAPGSLSAAVRAHAFVTLGTICPGQAQCHAGA